MTHQTGNAKTVLAVLACALGVIVMSGWAALGQGCDWYPSRWGADDQRGAANRLTPKKVLEAKDLIREGKVYQVGHLYETGIPVFGARHYSLRIPHTSSPVGENQVTYHEEIFSGELEQVGTQFDGLGHIGIGDLYYNGNSRHEFATAEGLTKLGVEHAGVFFSRGVLIDIAGYKGVDQLEGEYEITSDDIRGALQRQGTEIHSGDVVLIHTG